MRPDFSLDRRPEDGEWGHARGPGANGVNLHYVRRGGGDPVVLLHGWPEGNAAVQFLDPETGRQLTREEWDAIIAREVEEAKRAGKSLRSPIIVITDPD